MPNKGILKLKLRKRKKILQKGEVNDIKSIVFKINKITFSKNKESLNGEMLWEQ